MIKYFLKFFLLIYLYSVFFITNSFAEDEINLNWLTSAGNNYSHRFFSGDQINLNNINNLEKIWTFNSGSTAKYNTVQSPPIFIDDYC